jgi:hypothetical protein
LTYFGDGAMGESRRFRQTVSLTGCQDYFDRSLNPYSVSRGNKQRVDIRFCPDNGTDSVTIEYQRGVITGTMPRFVQGCSHQSCFCASNAGNIEGKTHMTGKTESPGMGDTLSVEDSDIGNTLELFESFQKHGTFSE